ncbi:MAG TPA: NAD(P)H-hydrate dehydratase, partial [Ilumatobacteraceae bacterium]|nr:NAD(P)H-hydrate dehydratase [Ilumatobacteraceae bacterium]
MTGAAHLAASAALRAGAGMVHLSSPGVIPSGEHEYVHRSVPAFGWSTDVLVGLDRFQSLVIGPGLGRGDDMVLSIRDV